MTEKDIDRSKDIRLLNSSTEFNLMKSTHKNKKENNITILQAGRWQEIVENACARGEQVGLSREFITRYLEAVHMESINRQKRILDS